MEGNTIVFSYAENEFSFAMLLFKVLNTLSDSCYFR